MRTPCNVRARPILGMTIQTDSGRDQVAGYATAVGWYDTLGCIVQSQAEIEGL